MREQRKRLSLVLVFLLLFNLCLPMSFVSADTGLRAGNDTTVTEDVYGGKEGEKSRIDGLTGATVTGAVYDSHFRLTDYKLTFEDKDGNEVEEVDLATIISVNYDWELDNGHGYQDGATFTFNLPPELIVYETLTNESLKNNGETMGTFSVDMNGEVTIVFNDFIERHSNINGNIEVLLQISKTVIVTEEKVVTVTPIQGGASTEIPINFTPTGNSIDKSGEPDKKYNAKEIEWTVDFNKHMKKITDAVLSDPIQARQELKPGSIKVYKLNMHMDGSIASADLINSGYIIGQTDDNGDFQISFGDIGSAYRVVFTTLIKDEDGTSYANKATLLGDGFTPLHAEATVGVQRGAPLAKRSSHYNPATQTITWEIKYNYNEKSIAQANAVLTDLFNDTQEIVIGEPPAILKDAFTIKKVEIDENGDEVGAGTDYTNFTATEITQGNQKGFELKFNEAINSAFKITYKTTASNRIFEDGTITNTVKTDSEEKSAGRNISQQILEKMHGTPNYKDKTITWTIVFNKDSYKMKDVALTDTFTNKGLLLKSDPDPVLKITNTKTNGVLGEGVDYHLTDNGENGFVIEFVDEIRDPHRIEYTTLFDYEDRKDVTKKYLQNHALLTWTDEKGMGKDKDVVATFTPDSYTQSNGFKGGSYNAETKEITWRVGINYNLQTLTNAYVEDTIQEGQTFKPETLEVYKLNLTGGSDGTQDGDPLNLNTDYTVVFTPDEQNPTSFRVDLVGDDDEKINSPYLVTFKTSLADQLIVKEYENTAKFGYAETTTPINLDAKVPVTHGGSYVTKTGNQNGKLIDWKVNINFGQSTVFNAKIIDTPSGNQTLLEDSFQLFETTVRENGTVEKGAALVRDTDYELEIIEEANGDESFEIIFLHNPITKPYILEYQSLILAAVGDSVTNEITFSGDNITTELVESKDTITVRRTTGMGTGTGKTGELEVIKVDAADTTKVLEGATFTLYDSDTNNKIKTLTTGPDGKATFTKLLYGDYYLKEDEAPTGYVVGIQNQQPVTIDSSMKELTVKNEEIKQAVRLTKVDQDDTNITLEGAEFDLQRKEGTEFVKISTHTTNDQGEIIVNNLDAGDYRFVETKAPEHYLLDNTPIEFTIIENQTALVEKTAKNERGKGKLILTKVDASDEQTKLEGAVFKLYNSANVLIDTKTTDVNGKVEFDNLPYDRYMLREITAPTHYVIDVTESNKEILIAQSTTEKTIKNHKLERSFKLIKVDARNKNITLAGAVFELSYKAPGSTDYIVIPGKDKLTTDDNGEIIETDLPVGDYQLIEIIAPSGYILDSKPIQFTIEQDQIKTLELVKENNRRSSGGGTPSGGGDKENPEPPKDEPEEEPEKGPESEENPKQPVEDENGDEQDSNHSSENDSNQVGEDLDSHNKDGHLSPDSEENASQSKKGMLPKTGENLPITPFIGILLIIGSLVLWFRKGNISN